MSGRSFRPCHKTVLVLRISLTDRICFRFHQAVTDKKSDAKAGAKGTLEAIAASREDGKTDENTNKSWDQVPTSSVLADSPSRPCPSSDPNENDTDKQSSIPVFLSKSFTDYPADVDDDEPKLPVPEDEGKEEEEVGLELAPASNPAQSSGCSQHSDEVSQFSDGKEQVCAICLSDYGT